MGPAPGRPCTNKLALIGLAVLSAAMLGAVLLVSGWVAGTAGAVACTTLTSAVFCAGWLAVPMYLRARATSGRPDNR